MCSIFDERYLLHCHIRSCKKLFGDMERLKRVAHCAKEVKYAHFFLPPISFRVLSQPSVKKSRAETSIGAIFRNLPPVRATQVGTKRYAILRKCRQPHSRCQCWAQERRDEKRGRRNCTKSGQQEKGERCTVRERKAREAKGEAERPTHYTSGWEGAGEAVS